jgi:hypothetical protein
MVILVCSAFATVQAADRGDAIHAVYRPDVRFPEFSPMWREGWSWTDESGERVRYGGPDMPLGGYLYACFRNSSDKPVKVEDLFVDGVSLVKGVPIHGTPKVRGDDKYITSIRFSKLPKDQIEKLDAAGAPVWWKVEPSTVPPGGLAEATIRLRRDPKVEEVTIGVPVDGRTVELKAKTSQRQPLFFSINFSTELDTVYAYLRHPSGKGVAPKLVLVDGKDVTARCKMSADAKVDTAAVIIRMGTPFERGSHHIFQAEYADGTTAVAGIRAWQLGFLYGMWGCDTGSGTPQEVGSRFLKDLVLHNVNLHMSHCPGPANDFMNMEEGYKMLEELGIQRMQNWICPDHRPAFYFLTDEPDAADFNSKELDPSERLGGLAQWLVDRCELFRRKDKAAVPLLLNVDNTFKPENWYMYAQLSDIPCADPYYQEAVQSVWSADPTNMAAYLKPTYVYGVGTIYQSAGAPNPMHLILHTCKFDFAPKECPYRGPTPEEKRVEVYYSLAAGAKQISYWWYCPNDRYHGVGAKDLQPLWTEIGLVGAEVGTVDSLVSTGCPAEVPVKSAPTVWCRSLLSGDDTMVLLVVNDNMASDRLGTVVKPHEKTRITVTPPAWLGNAAQVFEVDCDGTKDVKSVKSDGGIMLDLGTLNLTRMVVLTKNARLRAELQRVYETKYADNVQKLKAIK